MTYDFVHLHVHSEYSLLDGAIRTKQLADTVSQFHNHAVALTDHGVLYGALEFYEACSAKNINPILGCEIYVAPDGISSRMSKRSNHLILLAENLQGWHNLVKLVSIANTKGFYYKPRIDHDLIQQFHHGLIASSACLAGEIPQFIIHDELDNAINTAIFYDSVFGRGNFFLELMPNSMQEQKKVNHALLDISHSTGIPLIATCDAHYLTQDDYQWHSVLHRINTHSDKKSSPEAKSFGFDRNEYFLWTPEQMYSVFGDFAPEALTNTVDIAERCCVTLNLKHENYLLPHLTPPDGLTLADLLRQKAADGLRAKFSAKGLPVSDEYSKRLNYELDTIINMDFTSYFLIVSGIIQAAKDRHIPIGPGRGSAAGSVVAWALRITDLDPLKYHLLFERFLNPERISMPDIDTDVSDKGRDQLLKYISDTYGSDHVAQIITFGRMKGRQSIKDTGRVLGLDTALINSTAKLVPENAKSIDSALDDSQELKQLYDNDGTIHNVIDTARNIEGLARHTSQHAAGVVISPEPITDIVPVKRLASDKGEDTGQVVTQFTMEGVEKLGLVKMDFLGLSTLSIIDEAVSNIKLNGKIPPDWNAVHDAVDDAPTFKILQDADTIGVFQLESDGIRAMLRKLKIDCFDDLIAALAMYRPGPLDTGMVDQYIDCKHKRAVPHYPHPLLEGVLRETYGVILYQEQVMQAANILAGYSMGEADTLRKAMGKKKLDVMQAQRSKFLDGAQKNNIPQETAGKIFDDIEKFAGYGFNKSHSAAYALIAYDTAYLKAHFRVEFMAAYLSSQMKAKREVLGRYVLEVKKSGIDVQRPDINVSGENFTPDGDVIRFGLGAVARVGHNAVEMIINERNLHGSYKDLWDFIQRADLSIMNKTVLENLIKAGAFDTLNPNRAQLLEWLKLCLNAVQKHNKLIKSAQAKLNQHSQQLTFDFGDDDDTPHAVMPPMPDIPDFAIHDKLTAEKDVTGLYMSGHPYEAYSDTLRPYTNCSISDLVQEGQKWLGDTVKPSIAGIAAELNVKNTKKGTTMCIMKLEDSNSSIDVVLFAKTWAEVKDFVLAGKPYIIQGRLDDKGQFLPDKIIPADRDIHAQKYAKLILHLGMHANFSLRKFIISLNSCRGDYMLLVELRDNSKSVLMALRQYSVDPDKFLEAAAQSLPEGLFEFYAA
ncbi:MAG: DNA polymerase III subunit alpha [Synergistaceae bacterium]|nr:DNA polymerase III subunit alpha [Synergistaceae bacterium]